MEEQHGHAIPQNYTWEYLVKSYDTGAARKMRPSVILRLFQEVGELHLSTGHLEYNILQEKGMIFILLQSKCIIKKLPELGDQIKIHTWHRNTKGVRFFRCYQIFDQDDNIMVEGVGVFVLADLATHKVLRPHVFYDLGVSSYEEKLGGCPDPTPLKLDKTDLLFSATKKFEWSEIDWNMHTNNTVYADVMCNAFSEDMMNANKEMIGFCIFYIKEAVLGSTINIHSVKNSGDYTETGLVMGTFEDGSVCFEAEINFKAR